MDILKKIRERLVGDLTADDFPSAESSRREADEIRKRKEQQRDSRRGGEHR